MKAKVKAITHYVVITEHGITLEIFGERPGELKDGMQVEGEEQIDFSDPATLRNFKINKIIDE